MPHRFAAEGYRLPKPLINIVGKGLIQRYYVYTIIADSAMPSARVADAQMPVLLIIGSISSTQVLYQLVVYTACFVAVSVFV